MFDPELRIGQVLKNNDIVETFKCGNMGGMRRSHATNTLILISDYTKGLYHDKWIGGILHYTGMGKIGDQDINKAQNKTLSGYGHNDVDMHLFEVIDAGEYIYCGRIELIGEPYQENQPDDNGDDRKVWMFPIRPVPDNNVKKPPMFVFADLEDYKARGKNVDAEYAKMQAATKTGSKQNTKKVTTPTADHASLETNVEIPVDIVGKRIHHKTFGKGTIIDTSGKMFVVKFDSFGVKKLRRESFLKKSLIKIIDPGQKFVIEFKLGKMDEMFDKNEDLIYDYKDYSNTEEDEGNVYAVANYRIVIPKLHICLREATWYALNDESDPEDEEAWEAQDEVFLLYDENEKDINKWESSTTQSIYYSLETPCKKAGYPMEKVDDLDCYIEFDDGVEIDDDIYDEEDDDEDDDEL